MSQFQHRSIILAIQQMDERIDGLLFSISGSWRCLINETKPSHRKRYTMAHELVHNDRRRQYSWPFMESEEQKATWMERQTNAGAAAILMPEESVISF
ncbi:MAG: ImmA/IrrE family metallo-endopeptidase [Deltaproteobacteria bacterium]